jgi:hypothetical protein
MAFEFFLIPGLIFLFFYSIMLFVGISVFYWGFSKFRLKRLIEDTPTSKIRSIAMGFVEIYGKVLPVKGEGKTFRSPFAKKECVYYEYDIQEYHHSKNSSGWRTIKSGKEMSSFFVQDETGYVMVDPTNAQVDIVDNNAEAAIAKNSPAGIKQFVNSQGIKIETFFGGSRQLRYVEYLIEPGNNLYVMGTAGDNPFVPEGTEKQGFPDIMIQKGSKKGGFMIFMFLLSAAPMLFFMALGG